MLRAVQPVLTALLLLLFSSEYVALASFFQQKFEASFNHQSDLARHEIQVLGNLLAEQNEERDWRDDVIPVDRRVGAAVRPVSLQTHQHLHSKHYLYAAGLAVPRYTYYCNYLI